MSFKFIATLFLVLSSSISIASDSCNEVDNNLQLIDCTRQQFENSNKALHSQQDALESSILSLYKADLMLGNKLVEATREAQAAWLMYRDKQCVVTVFEIETTSPVYETSTQACLTKMNHARIKQLKDLAQSYD